MNTTCRSLRFHSPLSLGDERRRLTTEDGQFKNWGKTWLAALRARTEMRSFVHAQRATVKEYRFKKKQK